MADKRQIEVAKTILQGLSSSNSPATEVLIAEIGQGAIFEYGQGRVAHLFHYIVESALVFIAVLTSFVEIKAHAG